MCSTTERIKRKKKGNFNKIVRTNKYAFLNLKQRAMSKIKLHYTLQYSYVGIKKKLNQNFSLKTLKRIKL